MLHKIFYLLISQLFIRLITRVYLHYYILKYLLLDKFLILLNYKLFSLHYTLRINEK